MPVPVPVPTLQRLLACVPALRANLAAMLRREQHAGASEQANLYFRGAGIAIWVGCVNAALLALAFVGHVVDAALLAWLAAFVAIRLGRVALGWHFRQHGAAHPPRYWVGWMFGAMTVQGLCWGAASWVLMAPGVLLPELVLHVALIGIAGSAIHVFSAYPMLVAYTLSILAPLLLRDLWIGGWHLLLAAYPLLVGTYVLRAGYRQARVYGQAEAQRQRNAELIEALREQNAISAEARAQAEQAHAAKVRFFAAASHDLRQPLHALGLYAQAMRGPDAPAEVRALSRHIADCVDGMAHIVDELLELSQLDAGSTPPRLQRVPLAQLVHEVVAMHEPSAHAKGLALFVDLGNAAEAVVRTDPQQVRRVLTNLLSNALRYTLRGEVRIEVEAEAGGAHATEPALRVSVVDSGIGISAEQLPRIFEEFYQVGNDGRDRHQGLGLGLAIVQRLSALLGLDVRADSAPGKGSRFSIRLPLAGPATALEALEAMEAIGPDMQEGADAATAAAVASDPLRGRRIMLVEDDAASRDAMAQTLRQWGCEVRAASGTVAACAALGAGWRPELVIADLRLAGNDDGCRAAQALRARTVGELPVLLMTGDAESTTAARARETGWVVLRKPVKPAQLRACMNELFAQAEAAASVERATSP